MTGRDELGAGLIRDLEAHAERGLARIDGGDLDHVLVLGLELLSADAALAEVGISGVATIGGEPVPIGRRTRLSTTPAPDEAT